MNPLQKFAVIAVPIMLGTALYVRNCAENTVQPSKPTLEQIAESNLNSTLSFNFGASSIVYERADWQNMIMKFKKKTVNGTVNFDLPLDNKISYFKLSVCDPLKDKFVYVTADSIDKQVIFSDKKRTGITYYRLE